jgi:hypothetical protein
MTIQRSDERLMMTYRTMTVGGKYGNEYPAVEMLTAVLDAGQDGYDVIDVVDDLLIVADQMMTLTSVAGRSDAGAR